MDCCIEKSTIAFAMSASSVFDSRSSTFSSWSLSLVCCVSRRFGARRPGAARSRAVVNEPSSPAGRAAEGRAVAGLEVADDVVQQVEHVLAPAGRPPHAERLPAAQVDVDLRPADHPLHGQVVAGVGVGWERRRRRGRAAEHVAAGVGAVHLLPQRRLDLRHLGRDVVQPVLVERAVARPARPAPWRASGCPDGRAPTRTSAPRPSASLMFFWYCWTSDTS